jgi:hypothetical protein
LSERALTDAETTLARSVFGDAIDYARVRIVNRKWAFFQPKHIVMAPRGAIHFHPRGSLFIHEMTHVWQHQKGIFLPLRRHPFCRYDYSLKPGWTLERYGIEQQAEIVRHWFLLREGAHVPGAPPRAQYKGVLPFVGE